MDYKIDSKKEKKNTFAKKFLFEKNSGKSFLSNEKISDSSSFIFLDKKKIVLYIKSFVVNDKMFILSNETHYRKEAIPHFFIFFLYLFDIFAKISG